MTLLLDSTIRISILLLLALATIGVLRRRSAGLRHWVLALAFVGIATTPLLAVLVPAWSLPVKAAPFGRPQTSGHQDRTVVSSKGRADRSEVTHSPPANSEPAIRLVSGSWTSAGGRIRDIESLLIALWAAGVAIAGTVLVAGLARLRWMVGHSGRVTDSTWLTLAAEISRLYGLRGSPLLLHGTRPGLLITWGVRRPRILVPPSAAAWSAERIRIVLVHELAHVRRRDWAIQLLAHIVRAIYWFNPLVWAAFLRLRRESEHACDDAVLRHGISGTKYATHLIDLARGLQRERDWWPAPAMTRSCSLERRVRDMLNVDIDRRPPTRATVALTLTALLALTVPIAGLDLSAQRFITLSGTIADPHGLAIEDVTVTLANDERRVSYEVRSNAGGEYEFLGLLPGAYELQAEQRGFKTYVARIHAVDDVRRDLTLDIGSLRETVVVRQVAGSEQSASDAAGDGAAVPGAPRGEDRRAHETLVEQCQASAAAASHPAGGLIEPPRKTKHVPPAYPAAIESRGESAVVNLMARIDTSGLVSDVHPIEPTPGAELVAAAVDAVRQWQFTPTLLNCVPEPISMTVAVEFRPAPPPPPAAPLR